MAVQPATSLRSPHLLGIWDMEPGEVSLILDAAERFLEVSRRTIKKVPTLRGRTVINAFFEPSTRTRCSFEIAEKRLSADTLNFSTGGSSVSKGETLLDTVKNLEAMAPDTIVIRHKSPGVPQLLARHCKAAVVNAGDGAHEHPTQALLDALTIRQHKGRLEGLRVAIVGDILHSRVVRSNVFLLRKMGAEVVLSGPPMMMPRYVDRLGVAVARRVEEAVEGADVVMMLRIQLERMEGSVFPTVREYFARYALTEERLQRAKPDVIVMHPGPMNRGVEIMPDVADGPHSVILDQVTNGVAIRMAVLYLLSGGEGKVE
jgi:aspartate carbamoyltransferase catalytic subunit